MRSIVTHVIANLATVEPTAKQVRYCSSSYEKFGLSILLFQTSTTVRRTPVRMEERALMVLIATHVLAQLATVESTAKQVRIV